MSDGSDVRSDRYVEMVDPQGTILREIADRRLTRDDVAMTYAFAIVSRDAAKGGIDWGGINRAIIDRWSLSALKYIKTAAWRRVQEKQGSDITAPPSD